jgi:hypothetical protein
MSYNIFMLCHYSDTIVPDVRNSIIHNGGNSLLLNDNLGMSYAKMKEIICHGIRWNYNNIDVEITWRCQFGEHQYYHVLIVYDNSFKTMINFFIQSGLDMMVLYVSSRPKSLCVPTSGRRCSASQSVGPSKSVRRGKK